MLTSDELNLARQRIRAWPIPERRFLTKLTEPEVGLILEGVALLDLRPVEDEPEWPDPARSQTGRYHHDGGDTERTAAELVAPKSGTQRAAVLDALRAAGDRGATDHELWRATEQKCVRPHVAGTRREELIADGWPITDSGKRRTTDTGRPAIVWVLTP
jgi:hypothetical protein